MTTLTTTPCADVLARLFAEADASEARLDEWTNALPAGERAELMARTGDIRHFYGRLKEFHLAVSRPTASLLYMLARSSRAHSIIEFGTSFGLSTLHLAAALRDNGGGRLIGTEFEATKVAQARANIAAAGLGDLVEIRKGTARTDRPCAPRWSEKSLFGRTFAARASAASRRLDTSRQR